MALWTHMRKHSLECSFSVFNFDKKDVVWIHFVLLAKNQHTKYLIPRRFYEASSRIESNIMEFYLLVYFGKLGCKIINSIRLLHICVVIIQSYFCKNRIHCARFVCVAHPACKIVARARYQMESITFIKCYSYPN